MIYRVGSIRSADPGVVATAAIWVLLLLTGCSTSTPSAAPAPGDTSPYNDADIHFAQILVSHHDQAIAMSAIITDEPGVDSEIRMIADRITRTHQPQYELVESWTWANGGSVKQSPQESQGHHEVEDGLMNEKEMRALDEASGDAAEILYLDGMLRHHQGAITVAETELAMGKHADPLGLAREVVDNDRSELETLRDLRDRR